MPQIACKRVRTVQTGRQLNYQQPKQVVCPCPRPWLARLRTAGGDLSSFLQLHHASQAVSLRQTSTDRKRVQLILSRVPALPASHPQIQVQAVLLQAAPSKAAICAHPWVDFCKDHRLLVRPKWQQKQPRNSPDQLFARHHPRI